MTDVFLQLRSCAYPSQWAHLHLVFLDQTNCCTFLVILLALPLACASALADRWHLKEHSSIRAPGHNLESVQWSKTHSCWNYLVGFSTLADGGSYFASFRAGNVLSHHRLHVLFHQALTTIFGNLEPTEAGFGMDILDTPVVVC